MALKRKATDYYGDEESQKVRKGEQESSDNSDSENSLEFSSNPVDDDEAGRSKKQTKKQSFNQFWKEEDVIAILKIAAELKKKNGTDPSKNYRDLLQMVRKFVRSDATLIQLKNRIRRLKDSFNKKMAKQANGRDLVFSNPHDKQVFDLSKSIWGNDEAVPPITWGSQSQTRSLSLSQSLSLKLIERAEELGVPVLDFSLIEEGMNLISGSKKAEWDEEWKILESEELELFIKKLNLVGNIIKVIKKAMN